MIILGIDPGLKATGYGCIYHEETRTHLLETGTIQPKAKETLPERLSKVHSILTDIIDQYRPQVLVLEKLYAHYNHPITVGILGHVRGVICLVCAQRNLELAEYSVKRIRKAVCGNGNASKLQIRRVVARTLKVEEGQLPLDASDALALALGYAQMAGGKILNSSLIVTSNDR